MVIMQEILEKVMEYRGSKSITDLIPIDQESVIVKEQRVDGSYIGTLCIQNKIPMLRCTLIGSDRSPWINVLSNQQITQCKCFHNTTVFSGPPATELSEATPTKLPIISINPWFMTGFTDAVRRPGCFLLQVRNRNNSWYVEARFDISLHKKELALMKQIQDYFGGAGGINVHGEDSYQYTISSIKEINERVLPHFDNYPLITQKYSDYLLFKEGIYVINSKNNLTREEFIEKIVRIKASMNKGLLSDKLKTSFPNIVPTHRLKVESQIPHPQWVAGFTSGEGCFMIKTSVIRKAKLGYGVQLSFQITQNERDIELIKSLVSYLGCGRLVVNEKHNGSKVNFNVTKFSDIQELIIPFFLKHKILGVKILDFEDWCRAGEIIKNKGHLSSFARPLASRSKPEAREGLDEIFKLKAGINRARPK